VKINIDTIGENKALLRPYPFDIDPLPVSFSARLVPNRTYKDGEDFLGEFYRAERITVNHTLASAEGELEKQCLKQMNTTAALQSLPAAVAGLAARSRGGCTMRALSCMCSI
jgi:hypothetical protein